jgi:hypothetical protein
MNITQVHYQKLVNLGDYQNERYGAWANVAEGETPDEALEALKVWVGTQVVDRDQQDNLQRTVYRLEETRQNLERDITQMKARYEKAKLFVEGLGLEIPKRYFSDDDLPF